MDDRSATDGKAQRHEGRAANGARHFGFHLGLRERVLLLTIVFVMLAEVAIYVPSIANFRNNWLRDKLSSAYTAALVLEAAPNAMVPEKLKKELLDHVGAATIAMRMGGARRLLAISDMPPRVEERYDLREMNPLGAIAAAFRTLFSSGQRYISVIGEAPMGGDFVEFTMREKPLRDAMLIYSRNILFLSLMISLLVAAAAMAAIHLMVLRPVQRLTSSLVDFGADPEDSTRIITPSGRNNEIGQAEAALAGMQHALANELNQKKRLAALGLAVAKINHDLRNMLASAQLMSDRLANVTDPVTRRLAPKLIATLDRAISFCQSTLTYGRAVERAPDLAPVNLRTIAQDAAEIVSPAGIGSVEIVNMVPKDLQVQADPEQILRVMMNLFRNAVEALENAGPQPGQPAEVRISARRGQSGAVTIDISDTGPGIPEHARKNLFEAFQGSTRRGGTGLGLAIAAELLRAHGGTIELADGVEGAGATFRITLPARTRAAA